NQRTEQRHPTAGREAHGYVSLHPRGDELSLLGGPVGQCQKLTCFFEELPACGSQTNAAIVTIYERHINGSLELLHLPAQRRLRHRQALSSPPEMQVLGDGDEAAHLIECKHSTLLECRRFA